MNTSSYMDKQITELSSSNPSLLNLDDDDQDHAFNFHPIRPLSKSLDSAPIRGWSSMDQIDAAKVTGNRGGSSVDDELILRIEQKLKEHADALLHSMECLSARVSQIETRTRQVENSFDELKEAFEFNHGKLSGKLMELENVLMEVHTTVKDLRDKQEIADTQQLLAKLQASKTEKQPETQTTTVNQSPPTEPIPTHQSNQPPPVPVMFPQPLPPSPSIQNPPPQNYPPAPPATGHQFPSPPAPQAPTVAATAPQISFPQPESFPSVPISAPGASNPPYMPPNYQSQPPAFPHQPHSSSPLPPPAHQPYQPAPQLPPNSQLPQPPQPFPPANPRAEEPPYLQSHHGVQKPSQPHEKPPHQYYNPNSPQRNYNQLSNMRYPEPPSVDYNYNSPTHSGGSAMRPFQSSLPAPYTGGESGYSRLPTARELPRALPTASSVDSRSNGSESGNRVPIDDVIDKVVAMGFRRDLVRATVNKLTENGQHVDLNVVLDKLMNS